MVKAIYLRHATLADLAALEVLEQTFPGDRLSRRSLRHLLTRANAAVLVAEQDTLLGDAVVLFRKGSSRARLYSLVVAPEARGRGLGARLLDEVETEARARGCTELRLEVREDNVAATRLYERAGFQHIGRVDDYYEDHAGAVKMVKNSGSGPLANDSSTFKVVAHKEHMKTAKVHVLGLRERQSFSDETS